MADWKTTTTHSPHECGLCAEAVQSAITMARVTGSVGATYTVGTHVAVVERGTHTNG